MLKRLFNSGSDRPGTTGFISAISLLGFLLFCAAAETRGSSLTANVAVTEITPPLEMKYTLGGYGERMNRPAEGIHDPIMAKALALKKDNQKYLILTLDILGLPSNVKPDLLERIADLGWRMENVMLLPSHSHGSLEMAALNSKNLLGSPHIGIFQPELLQFILDKLENLVREADRNYRPVVTGTVTRNLEGLNRNRRKDPFIDKELTVTRIDLTTGEPLAVLVNWTAHPTFIGGTDMMVSAEWPGYLQTTLEEMIGKGVTVMYYNGAEGDQSPVLTEKSGPYENIRTYGTQMAKEAFNLYRKIIPKNTSKFSYRYKTIDLPSKSAHPDFMKTGGAEYGLDEQTVKIVMDMLGPDQTGLGCVSIGDMVIAGVPGEMTAELGLMIKKAVRETGINHVTIGGLANEWISYILTRKQYELGGGYESSVSFYGAGLGELITGEVIQLSSQCANTPGR